MVYSYRIQQVISSFLVFWLGFAGPAVAMQFEAAKFDEVFELGSTRLVLNGVGLKKFLVFKIVAVGLYVVEGADPREILNDVPKRLEVEYFQRVPKEELIRATNKGIADNVDKQTFDKLQDQIQQINDMYVNVAPGDRYSITYYPKKGTELALNGQIQGIIKGADFAAAFFSIYLGDKPADQRIKDKLLKN